MNTMQLIGDTLTPLIVNSMIRVLNEEVKKDANLAYDLLLFLQERNIEVPIPSNDELGNLIPVSFKHQNSSGYNTRIQHAFEGISSNDEIL